MHSFYKGKSRACGLRIRKNPLQRRRPHVHAASLAPSGARLPPQPRYRRARKAPTPRARRERAMQIHAHPSTRPCRPCAVSLPDHVPPHLYHRRGVALRHRRQHALGACRIERRRCGLAHATNGIAQARRKNAATLKCEPTPSVGFGRGLPAKRSTCIVRKFTDVVHVLLNRFRSSGLLACTLCVSVHHLRLDNSASPSTGWVLGDA